MLLCKRDSRIHTSHVASVGSKFVWTRLNRTFGNELNPLKNCILVLDSYSELDSHSKLHARTWLVLKKSGLDSPLNWADQSSSPQAQPFVREFAALSKIFSLVKVHDHLVRPRRPQKRRWSQEILLVGVASNLHSLRTSQVQPELRQLERGLGHHEGGGEQNLPRVAIHQPRHGRRMKMSLHLLIVNVCTNFARSSVHNYSKYAPVWVARNKM